jgi:meiotically up-regulated gene 157 (Mug157) protein
VAREPEILGSLVRGVINRHVDSVLLDPYAMTFSWVAPDGESNRHTFDNTTCLDAEGNRVNAMDKKMGVRERKFELDSTLGTLRLCRKYFNHTGDIRPFDSRSGGNFVGVYAREGCEITLSAMQSQ